MAPASLHLALLVLFAFASSSSASASTSASASACDGPAPRVCAPSVHPPPPVINVTASLSLELRAPEILRVGLRGGGGAYRVSVAPSNEYAFVGNLGTGSVDRYFLPQYGGMEAVGFLEEERVRYGEGGFGVRGVATCAEAVVVGMVARVGDDKIVMLDEALGKVDEVVAKGCKGMGEVGFSADCGYVVAVCGGDGRRVKGGVVVVTVNGGAFGAADFVGFEELDGEEKVAALKNAGVRFVETDKPSLDFEPEGLVVVGNNSAYVTLQEANAVAIIDLVALKVVEIRQLGCIDRSKSGFGMDASAADGGIEIRNCKGLYAMPQPSAITSYTAGDGKVYLVFANEGDGKRVEEVRGADIVGRLNRTTSKPALKALLEDDALLGRLKVSSTDGFDTATAVQEAVYTFGARSFSIMSAESGVVVFDSGEWLARIAEKSFPEIFNSNGYDVANISRSQEDTMDSRSEEKGSEPKSLSMLSFAKRNFVFVGCNRSTIITVFDVTDPRLPVFVDATHNNPSGVSARDMFSDKVQGDIGVTGLDANARKMKLYVTGSASSTFTSYDIISNSY